MKNYPTEEDRTKPDAIQEQADRADDRIRDRAARASERQDRDRSPSGKRAGQKNWQGNLIIIVIMVLVSLTSLLQDGRQLKERPATGLVPVEVERAVDGDTLVVHLDGERERLRLIGIDTPESVAPEPERNSHYGDLASRYMEMYVDQYEGDYWLEWDEEKRDQYDRLLAYVWTDDGLLNEKLCRDGFARAGYYPPNLKYNEELHQAEFYAQEHGLGLWGNLERVEEALGFTADKKP